MQKRIVRHHSMAVPRFIFPLRKVYMHRETVIHDDARYKLLVHISVH